MKDRELTKSQLKFLVALWSVAIILMLFVGYHMVTISFPTTPLYGKFISLMVYGLCITFALSKLLRYISKLK